MNWFNLLLIFIGAFGFGWGLAERENRKSIKKFDSYLDRLERKIERKIQFISQSSEDGSSK